MSSTYSKNKKELSGVKVVSASDVWQKRNGKFRLRKDIDIVEDDIKQNNKTNIDQTESEQTNEEENE